MITENYLQIMIDSLLKKIEILKKVSELNEQQSALLDDKEFDGDKLQSNMESKAAYIDDADCQCRTFGRDEALLIRDSPLIYSSVATWSWK